MSELMKKLEALVDEKGLDTVVGTLSELCLEKASHVRENWQDELLAKTWEAQAKVLDKALAKIG